MSFNVYGYDVYISLIVHLNGVNLSQIFNVIVKIENMFKIWSLLMKSDIKLPWVVEMMSIGELSITLRYIRIQINPECWTFEIDNV